MPPILCPADLRPVNERTPSHTSSEESGPLASPKTISLEASLSTNPAYTPRIKGSTKSLKSPGNCSSLIASFLAARANQGH
jgi:hypothetical protein